MSTINSLSVIQAMLAQAPAAGPVSLTPTPAPTPAPAPAAPPSSFTVVASPLVTYDLTTRSGTVTIHYTGSDLTKTGTAVVVYKKDGTTKKPATDVTVTKDTIVIKYSGLNANAPYQYKIAKKEGRVETVLAAAINFTAANSAAPAPAPAPAPAAAPAPAPTARPPVIPLLPTPAPARAPAATPKHSLFNLEAALGYSRLKLHDRQSIGGMAVRIAPTFEIQLTPKLDLEIKPFWVRRFAGSTDFTNGGENTPYVPNDGVRGPGGESLGDDAEGRENTNNASVTTSNNASNGVGLQLGANVYLTERFHLIPALELFSYHDFGDNAFVPYQHLDGVGRMNHEVDLLSLDVAARYRVHQGKSTDLSFGAEASLTPAAITNIDVPGVQDSQNHIGWFSRWSAFLTFSGTFGGTKAPPPPPTPVRPPALPSSPPVATTCDPVEDGPALINKKTEWLKVLYKNGKESDGLLPDIQTGLLAIGMTQPQIDSLKVEIHTIPVSIERDSATSAYVPTGIKRDVVLTVGTGANKKIIWDFYSTPNTVAPLAPATAQRWKDENSRFVEVKQATDAVVAIVKAQPFQFASDFPKKTTTLDHIAGAEAIANDTSLNTTQKIDKLEKYLRDQGIFTNFDVVKAKMDEIVKAMAKAKDVVCYLAATTDTSGSDAYNQALSERRAGIVQLWMKVRGLQAKAAFGLGEKTTLIDKRDTTSAKKQANRQVLIAFKEPPASAGANPAAATRATIENDLQHLEVNAFTSVIPPAAGAVPKGLTPVDVKNRVIISDIPTITKTSYADPTAVCSDLEWSAWFYLGDGTGTHAPVPHISKVSRPSFDFAPKIPNPARPVPGAAPATPAAAPPPPPPPPAAPTVFTLDGTPTVFYDPATQTGYVTIKYQGPPLNSSQVVVYGTGKTTPKPVNEVAVNANTIKIKYTGMDRNARYGYTIKQKSGTPPTETELVKVTFKAKNGNVENATIPAALTVVASPAPAPTPAVAPPPAPPPAPVTPAALPPSGGT